MDNRKLKKDGIYNTEEALNFCMQSDIELESDNDSDDLTTYIYVAGNLDGLVLYIYVYIRSQHYGRFLTTTYIYVISNGDSVKNEINK